VRDEEAKALEQLIRFATIAVIVLGATGCILREIWK
jgi:hypothetical protein